MPADKLTLLCPRLSPQFEKIADRKGKPKAGYSRFLDLRSEFQLPAFLYHGGFYWPCRLKTPIFILASSNYLFLPA